MTTRTRRTLVLVVAVLSLLAEVSFVGRAYGTEEFSQHAVFAVAFLGYPLMAIAILWRRSHPVGYLLLGISTVSAASGLDALLEQPAPPGTSVGWRLLFAVTSVVFPLFAMLLPALGLRFPDGRRLSPRWRWVEYAYVIGVTSVVVAMLLSPTIIGGPGGNDTRWELANPLATSWTEPIRRTLELAATVTLAPAIISSIVAVVVRFRRSRGVERQQLRWLTYGVLGVVLTWPLVAGAAMLVGGDEAAGVVSGIYSMLLFAVPPLGMGVAITRYRLYDLDRLLSRTLSYAVVTLVLAALYAGAVVGLGSLLRPLAGGDSDVVVAASTLLVAGAFRPVRRRVQSAVDRRFNRARVDGLSAVEDFARRLRDEVDLIAVVNDLRSTAVRTLQPAGASVLTVPSGGTRS